MELIAEIIQIPEPPNQLGWGFISGATSHRKD
jgi:hypothetical protein